MTVVLPCTPSILTLHLSHMTCFHSIPGLTAAAPSLTSPAITEAVAAVCLLACIPHWNGQ